MIRDILWKLSFCFTPQAGFLIFGVLFSIILKPPSEAPLYYFFDRMGWIAFFVQFILGGIIGAVLFMVINDIIFISILAGLFGH